MPCRTTPKDFKEQPPLKRVMKIVDLQYSERPEEWKRKHRATNKRYKQRHREKRRAEKRRYYQRHREEILRKSKEKAQSNRKVINAQRIAERIPLKESCEECGSKDQLERHHPDYSKPKEFVTLCRRCHQAKHGSF